MLIERKSDTREPKGPQPRGERLRAVKWWCPEPMRRVPEALRFQTPLFEQKALIKKIRLRIQ
jgi:hypothetical protein